jgi:AraC-like DNA-binding protein
MPDKDYKKVYPFDYLLQYDTFLSILKYYIDLNCFVVSLTPIEYWVAVNYHYRLDSVFDLEKKYGYARNWNRIIQPGQMKKPEGEQNYLVENFGFFDACVPILEKGKWLGNLISGAFADKELTYSQLQKSWNQLTGKTASPGSPEFREFVRVALDTPVLEGQVLQAFMEALELFARLLVSKGKEKKVQWRIRELIVEVFSKQFPHSLWMNWALGLPARQTIGAWDIRAQELYWLKYEIGLTRLPTTVITAIPVKPSGKKSDPVEEMLRVYRFQRKSFHFAKTLTQTVGGRLENYGSVFVTSPDPSKNRLQRRHQIAETAQRIHRFAVEELGGPALVGIGETVAPGEPLNESYRQAVLALHLGRQTGRELLFFSPVRDAKPEGMLELRRLLLDLKRQFETASFSDMEVVLDGFLKQVLTLSFQSPEEIRWHLQYGLIQLMEAMKNRTDLQEKESHELYEGLVLTLEGTGTTQEMVLAFKEALAKLVELTQGPAALKSIYSIEKVRSYLEEHFRSRINFSQLARISKISASTLGRRFKKTTGSGMEVYLQSLRLDEARRLLKTGNLPVSQIARACGFKTGSYFIRLFRKKTGLSPQKYRQKSKSV